MSKTQRAQWIAWLLNFPSIAIILALTTYPVVYSLWVSFHRYNLRNPDSIPFVGLGNYIDVLNDPVFWGSLKVTLYFCIISVTLVIIIGMMVALLFDQPFSGRGLARALLLIPWAIPGVINGLMWKGLLTKAGGINGLLNEFVTIVNLGIRSIASGNIEQIATPISFAPSWLSHSFLALNSACAAHIWKEVPFAAIVFLATLQAVPKEEYAAARVDGAGGWNRFRYITLPWLAPAIVIVAIFETMTSFRTFDLIFTLTGGGPGRGTNIIAHQTYREAFTFLNFGAANAYCYLIAVITVGLSVAYIRLLRKGATIA